MRCRTCYCGLMSDTSEGWSAIDIVRAAIRDVRRRPVVTLLLIGILPTLWGGLLFDWCWAHLLGLAKPPWPLDLKQIVPTTMYRLAGDALRSTVMGGQYLIALDVARGLVPRPERFIHGLRFSPRIFAATVAISLVLAPGQIISTFRHWMPTLWSLIAPLAYLLVSLAILARTAAWIPLIVDRRESLFIAAANSWTLTRVSTWRIVCVYLVLGLFMLLLAVAHNLRVLEQAILSVDQCVGTIVVAQLYLQLIGHKERASEPAPIVGSR